jgi:hypothetical protein
LNNLGLFILPKAKIIEIGPILPKIINNVSIIFDVFEATAIKPEESPTVPNAEQISNKILFVSIFFSRDEIKIRDNIIVNIPKVAIVMHLLTCSSGIFRPKIEVLEEPVIVLLINANITINVLTLIPPAVDADAPPINIKVEHQITVDEFIKLKGKEEKPAVLPLIVLNIECLIEF